MQCSEEQYLFLIAVCVGSLVVLLLRKERKRHLLEKSNPYESVMNNPAYSGNYVC